MSHNISLIDPINPILFIFLFVNILVQPIKKSEKRDSCKIRLKEKMGASFSLLVVRNSPDKSRNNPMAIIRSTCQVL